MERGGMMKKKMIGIGAVVLLVGGFLLWVHHQDVTRADSKVEYSEMNYTITTVETDVEGLVVEATITYSENPESRYPSLVFTFTNNGEEDMSLVDECAYYKKGQNWQKALYNESYMDPLIGYSVFCMDTVKKMQTQLEDSSMVSNILKHGYSPWGMYRYMDKPGTYRFEVEIVGEGEIEDKFGTVWVEWTQELK